MSTGGICVCMCVCFVPIDVAIKLTIYGTRNKFINEYISEVRRRT